MKIEIHRLNKYSREGSSLKAFIDLIVEDELVVKGFKLIEGKEGLFLGNPSEKTKDDKFFDTVRFQNLDVKKEIEDKVIAKYQEE